MLARLFFESRSTNRLSSMTIAGFPRPELVDMGAEPAPKVNSKHRPVRSPNAQLQLNQGTSCSQYMFFGQDYVHRLDDTQSNRAMCTEPEQELHSFHYSTCLN